MTKNIVYNFITIVQGGKIKEKVKKSGKIEKKLLTEGLICCILRELDVR
jgi:hypothetical protein